jgi:hypothetical protein
MAILKKTLYLKDQVTIVDTPGVGESEEISKRLFEYLPNAVAFIYVINSANAGGIQEDRVCTCNSLFVHVFDHKAKLKFLFC